jgi:hypothetical protein
MKHMKHLNVFILGLLMVSFLFSCKDDEQSCSDGVFSPEEEHELDCGGVCPPCPSGNPNPYSPVLLCKVNDSAAIFHDYSLSKNPNWILNFSNDTIVASLNFGDGDSLGARSIIPNNSGATVDFQGYSTLIGGTVLFSEINHTDNRLSGFFEAKLLSDSDPNDTLILTNGDFEDVLWE